MSCEDAPARKRARSSSLEPTGDLSVHDVLKDEELWFEDGNVILLARNVQFRVYQGMLAALSPRLKDMFSLTRQSVEKENGQTDSEPTCLIVRLEDSPEDLRHILRAYMPLNDSSPHKPPVSLFYHAISASIRLGHKYQITKLVDSSLKVLQLLFPVDVTLAPSRDVRLPKFEGSGPEQAIGVVNLARLTGNTSILSTALLFCCALGGDIVHGLKREDGSREYLSPEDLSRCFNGISRLSSATLAAAVSVFMNASSSCLDKDKMIRSGPKRGQPLSSSCSYSTPTVVSSILPLIDRKVASGQFIYPLQSFLNILDAPKLCGKCRTTLQEEDLKARQALWKRLPVIFDLTAA